MQAYLLVLALLCAINLPAQQNYIDYHHRYYEMEALIAQEKFVEAEDQLLALFVNYKPKFAKDYLVAAQLCTLNKHEYLGIEFLEKAMLMGVKKECIEEMEIFSNWMESPKWKRLMNNYGKLRFQYAQRINFDLMKELSGRYQTARNTLKTRGEIEGQEMAQRNFERLQSVIKEFGFPGQKMVGIDDSYYNQNNWNEY